MSLHAESEKIPTIHYYDITAYAPEGDADQGDFTFSVPVADYEWITDPTALGQILAFAAIQTGVLNRLSVQEDGVKKSISLWYTSQTGQVESSRNMGVLFQRDPIAIAFFALLESHQHLLAEKKSSTQE